MSEPIWRHESSGIVYEIFPSGVSAWTEHSRRGPIDVRACVVRWYAINVDSAGSHTVVTRDGDYVPPPRLHPPAPREPLRAALRILRRVIVEQRVAS
jgi:hypothetical protein